MKKYLISSVAAMGIFLSTSAHSFEVPDAHELHPVAPFRDVSAVLDQLQELRNLLQQYNLPGDDHFAALQAQIQQNPDMDLEPHIRPFIQVLNNVIAGPQG